MDSTSPNELKLYNHSLSAPSASSLTSEVQIHYIPVASPPTPAASPPPSATSNLHPDLRHDLPIQPTNTLHTFVRREYLMSILRSCTRDELYFVSDTIRPLLQRQFQFTLPEELVVHILSFVELSTLMKASLVSKQWFRLTQEESLWQALCVAHDFDDCEDAEVEWRQKQKRNRERIPLRYSSSSSSSYSSSSLSDSPSSSSSEADPQRLFSYRRFFRDTCMIHANWRCGGKLLQSHHLPVIAPDSGTVTSAALDREWLVVGFANAMIKVYRARTGVLVRTLLGHDSGVWGVCLVSAGGAGRATQRRARARSRTGVGTDDVDGLATRLANVEFPRDGLHVLPGESLGHLVPPVMQQALGFDAALPEGEAAAEQTGHGPAMEAREGTSHKTSESASSPCFASLGWGQPNPIIVSGGCDKVVRVWDLKSGQCIYALHGHVSTIRSLRLLHTRPVAVTGSRDATLRVWDVQRGRCLRVLAGHAGSVRCLDVFGNRVVSGSYDTTCRLWNIDTGECLRVLSGHFSQIYSVAFDGVRVASGGLDTSVRIWDADTGQCTALLQGHTALVCQLQLSPTHLLTGGADGRVITFALDTMRAQHRLAAHASSVTALQLDARAGVLVTGGNDGRVRVFDARTGEYVRELVTRGDGVWKVVLGRETCAVMCKREGKTVVEIWSMHPRHTRAAVRAADRAGERHGADGGPRPDGGRGDIS